MSDMEFEEAIRKKLLEITVYKYVVQIDGDKMIFDDGQFMTISKCPYPIHIGSRITFLKTEDDTLIAFAVQ